MTRLHPFVRRSSQSTVTKGKLEGQINVLNEQIHTAEMTDEHLKSRLDSIDREKQERIESRGTYEAEKQELDTELAAAATEKETAAEQLRNIQEEIARCTEGIEKGKNEIIELLNRKASVKARQQRYDTMMEQVNIRKAQLTQRLLARKTEEADAYLRSGKLSEGARCGERVDRRTEEKRCRNG